MDTLCQSKMEQIFIIIITNSFILFFLDSIHQI